VSSSATRETKIQLGGLGALLDSLFMVAGFGQRVKGPRESHRWVPCLHLGMVRGM